MLFAAMQIIDRPLADGSRSPEQVTERVDKLIMKIRELHAPNMHGENEACNVLLVSFHGA